MRCQKHCIAALQCNVRCMFILSDDVAIINESDSWLTCINGSCLVTIYRDLSFPSLQRISVNCRVSACLKFNFHNFKTVNKLTFLK